MARIARALAVLPLCLLLLSPGSIAAQAGVPGSDTPCPSDLPDASQMDVIDAHAHITPQVSVPQVIAHMNAAGVSVVNLYGTGAAATAPYPGRFITFVDTPDGPPPTGWVQRGQAFVTQADADLSTGRYSGIGETNLRYYRSPDHGPRPDISVAPDNPIWLQLVNLAARYHVPISFHWVPDDPAANAGFDTMLGANADATMIWAHLGFSEWPLDKGMLTDYLLRHPNLYLDTATLHQMRNDPPRLGANWWVLADRASGRSTDEWRQFFETWNSRILVGTDAGGGSESLERWQNYAENASSRVPGNTIGQWRRLLSNLDRNAAQNILGGNARRLLLKEPTAPYRYAARAGGECVSVTIRSESSVSRPLLDARARSIGFTVASSSATAGAAEVTVPASLIGASFSLTVDGQGIDAQSSSDGAIMTVTLHYPGGVHAIVITARE